jgi:hypothetical protein
MIGAERERERESSVAAASRFLVFLKKSKNLAFASSCFFICLLIIKGEKMKKTKLMKSLMGIGTLSFLGISTAVTATSCSSSETATSLVLGNVPYTIDGYTNMSLSPTSTITCTTNTGAAVQDAEYSIVNQPAGLSINKTNGSISGTPTVKQSGTFTITVTSEAFGLYTSVGVPFNIVIANTILISPETLANDAALSGACNLTIDSGTHELDKKMTETTM